MSSLWRPRRCPEVAGKITSIPLGPVLGNAGFRKTEPHPIRTSHGINREHVVSKCFTALDVVLVLVRPVKEDLLATVRHSMLFSEPVSPPRQKVAAIVVAREECVEMIEHIGLLYIACADCLQPLPMRIV